jgi:hypothetical protein
VALVSAKFFAAEIIQGRKLFKDRNYSQKYCFANTSHIFLLKHKLINNLEQLNIKATKKEADLKLRI